MSTDLGGYRFQDDGVEPMRGSDSPVVYSVEFHPSLEDHARLFATKNEEQQHLTSWSKFSVQAFVFVNMIVCPGLLLFYGVPIVALIIFGTNLVVAGFFLRAIVRTDYRRYLRVIYGDDFFRIELTEDGVFSRHQGDVSVLNWRSITRIEEDETSYTFISVSVRSSLEKAASSRTSLRKVSSTSHDPVSTNLIAPNCNHGR